ncbi:hypothetical protein [Halalkalibacter sp. APA_J-10(15)]|nr:hypothetical protein [Halalkalibacter sp. APA_J-10(15)]MCK0471412.1 hypothetical protein [Halalkalibacter sp. APA_J-10(15)]
MKPSNKCPVCESYRTFIESDQLHCHNCGEVICIQDIEEDLKEVVH